MLILDGIPGAGKTTHLGRLLTQCPDRVIPFPEAQPPQYGGDATAVPQLLDEDRTRTDMARRLEQQNPYWLVASDRCHLGVLAYRYAWARLTNRWADFDRAVARSAVLQLDERHYDDTLLILHLNSDASLRRRNSAAVDPRHKPWYDPAFLAGYIEFFTQLTQWVTPGPRWAHYPADSTAIASTIRALRPATRASAAVSNQDLCCGNGCGTPRSATVTSITSDAAVQLWCSALHHQPPGKPVRCLRTAEAVVHTRGLVQ